MDINGNKPEIYMVTTNRTGGKTTYFGRLCLNRWFDSSEKFCLLYRYNYELDDVADKFYKDIGSLFFPDTVMTSKRKAKGIYHELYIDGKHCGYAVAINNADAIKRLSHLFSDVKRMLMDEFQSETNHYCSDEVRKFMSVHDSIARGQNKQTRYVPVYMLANAVSLINPYYVSMNISQRLDNKTKYLKGDGWVLEQGYVDSAARALKESAFHRAFANSEYDNYSTGQNVYLNDNLAFVEKPNGTGRYIATLRYNGCNFAIREYREDGVLYCDDKADITYPMKISVTTEDHNINYVMLKSNDFIISNFRYYFEHGCFRFKDLRSKEALMKCISY